MNRIQSPDIGFPVEFVQIAAALSENFIPQAVEPEPEPASGPAAPKRQKQGTTSRSNGTLQPTGEIKLVPTKKAPADHPIFGETGIMRGISIRKVKAIAYVVDPAIKRDFRVFGHNGLAVGSVWPLMCAACRDGAHGKFLPKVYHPPR